MNSLTATATSRRAGCRTFRAAKSGGVWQVTRDGVFYGDFLSQDQALRCACDAARAIEASGGAARVLGPVGDTVIPHNVAAR